MLADVDVYGERFPTRHAQSAGWTTASSPWRSSFVHRGVESILARGSVKRGFRMNLEVLGDGLRWSGSTTCARSAPDRAGTLFVDARIGGHALRVGAARAGGARRLHYLGERMEDSTSRTSRPPTACSPREGEVLGAAQLRERPARPLEGAGLRAPRPARRLPGAVLYPRGADGEPDRRGGERHARPRRHFGDDPTPAWTSTAGWTGCVAEWAGHRLTNPDPWVFACTGRASVPMLRLPVRTGRTLPGSRATPRQGGSSRSAAAGPRPRPRPRVVPELSRRGSAPGDLRVASRRRTATPRTRVTAQLDDATLRSGCFPEAFEALTANWSRRRIATEITG